MKKLLFILCVSTGVIFGCNSGKKSAGGFGKKGSSSIGAPGKHTAANSNAASDSAKTAKLDSLSNNYYYDTQPKAWTNFQGATGIGTGGSHASHAYRHDIMSSAEQEKTARRRAYFKRRTFDPYYDQYYPQAMRVQRPATEDTLLITEELDQKDTTAYTLEEW